MAGRREPRGPIRSVVWREVLGTVGAKTKFPGKPGTGSWPEIVWVT